MTVGDRSTTAVAVGVLALLVSTAALFAFGGLPGLLFGVGAAAAWVLAPPVFAFAVGQAGVAAVTGPPYPPLVLAAELALLALLVSDSRVPLDAGTWVVPVAASALLAAGAWIALSQSLLAAAGWCLAGLAALTYAVHRYELLATGQLAEVSPDE